jgi:hypothetical protein
MQWIRRYLSVDDLWSALGYVLLIVLAHAADPDIEIARASALASGMLAVFWLLSADVRARNVERYPNIRVGFWATITAASLIVILV